MPGYFSQLVSAVEDMGYRRLSFDCFLDRSEDNATRWLCTAFGDPEKDPVYGWGRTGVDALKDLVNGIT